MDQVLQLADFLKDKKMLKVISQSLGFIFVASTASYIFQTFYFEYELNDISAYKENAEFLLDGRFFVPLCIFAILWGATYCFGYLLFFGFNDWIAQKIRRVILNYSIKSNPYKRAKTHLMRTQQVQEHLPQELPKDWHIKFYQAIKAKLKDEDIQAMEKGFVELKEDMIRKFIVIVRGFIAVTIYFNTLPHFGGILYSLAIGLFVIGTLIVILGYQLGELLPVAVRKYSFEMEQIITELKEGTDEDTD